MTDRSKFDNALTYDAKRQALFDEMVGDILEQGIDKHEIAVRTVSMLILAKGNINHWQECIDLMFDVIEHITIARERMDKDVNPST